MNESDINMEILKRGSQLSAPFILCIRMNHSDRYLFRFRRYW